MTKLKQVYKCEVCGNMTEVVHASVEELVCCGQPKTLQPERTIEKSIVEKNIIEELEKDVTNKEIYIGENDEEVLNCEGNPCNFVYDDTEIQKK